MSFRHYASKQVKLQLYVMSSIVSVHTSSRMDYSPTCCLWAPQTAVTHDASSSQAELERARAEWESEAAIRLTEAVAAERERGDALLFEARRCAEVDAAAAASEAEMVTQEVCLCVPVCGAIVTTVLFFVCVCVVCASMSAVCSVL